MNGWVFFLSIIMNEVFGCDRNSNLNEWHRAENYFALSFII